MSCGAARRAPTVCRAGRPTPTPSLESESARLRVPSPNPAGASHNEPAGRAGPTLAVFCIGCSQVCACVCVCVRAEGGEGECFIVRTPAVATVTSIYVRVRVATE